MKYCLGNRIFICVWSIFSYFPNQPQVVSSTFCHQKTPTVWWEFLEPKAHKAEAVVVLPVPGGPWINDRSSYAGKGGENEDTTSKMCMREVATLKELLLMVEIRRSPVEVGRKSHYLQGFIHPRWWSQDFWIINNITKYLKIHHGRMLWFSWFYSSPYGSGITPLGGVKSMKDFGIPLRSTRSDAMVAMLGQSKKLKQNSLQTNNASWWLNQPLWKICSSNWESSPIFGVKIKIVWNHHPECNKNEVRKSCDMTWHRSISARFFFHTNSEVHPKGILKGNPPSLQGTLHSQFLWWIQLPGLQV